ncbi:MAG: hypothetical protein V5A24_03060 [Haloarculaceae archaeon]
MSESMDRPFSRLYAELRRQAGDEPESEDADEDADSEWLGTPKLANPRRSSDDPD